MYLKELTLRGFKSFASTTSFEFEPGITCIVGPNGSGKSNVVDALAWVMGEQGAKSLRGSNMADVIFAGGGDRPALGRAQVLLTIDNGDGKLPIPYSEVTISRTMFRSGGSEYAINGQTVRLLDVQELLSDTGLGREMHVIVGQGALDSVLSASPLDRRAFIDEAAGVAKHRKRKDRARSKLEAMDADLLRVLDLTEELKRGLRPLARQAKAAEAARGIQTLLAYASARLLADDAVDVTRRVAGEATRLTRLRIDHQEVKERAGFTRDEVDRLRGERNYLREGVSRAQEVYRDFSALHDRMVAIVELAQEKERGAAHFAVSISDQAVEAAAGKAEETARQAKDAEGAAEDAERDYERAVAAREDAQRDLREAERQKAQAIRRGEQERKQYLRLKDQSEVAERALVQAQSHGAAAQKRLQEASGRLSQAQKVAAALPGSGQSPASGEDDWATRFELATQKEKHLREDLAAAQQEGSRLQALRSALVAKVEALTRSVDARRGQEGNKSRSRGEVTSGRMGRLADVLNVTPGWEEAAQALLSPLLEAWLVPDEQALKQVTEELPGNLDAPSAGAAGYVALPPQRPAKVVSAAEETRSTSRPNPTEGEDVGVSPTDGADAAGARRATEVIEGRGEHATLVAHLLRDRWVAEDNQRAWEAVENLPGRAVVATRGGGLLTREALLLRRGPETSTLALQAEVHQATGELEATTKEHEDAAARAAALKTELAETTKRREHALKQLRAADAKRATEERERVRVNAVVHAASEEVARLQTQLEDTRRAITQAETELESASAALPAAMPPTKSEQEVAAARDVEKAAGRVEAAWGEENDLRMDAHVSKERAAAALRQARAFKTQAATLNEDRTRQIAKQEAATKARQSVAGVAEAAGQAAREAEQGAKQAGLVREQLTDLAGQLSEEIGARKVQLERAERDSASLGDQLLQTEVAAAQASAAHDVLLAGIETLISDWGHILAWDEAGAARDHASHPDHSSAEDHGADQDGSVHQIGEEDVAYLIAAYGPANPWLPPGDEGPPVPYVREVARQTQRKAAGRLARLGVVNPLAVEEYAASKERYDYMVSQVDDISESKSHLLHLIADIDGRVREAFEDAYNDTARQFKETFATLFPGGEGRLELTDPGSPLTTGVEIYARPAGKKVTRLSLLSGGERSLAALAYLFAIFRARPSPFYVMDEVEAALDDINLTRVLSLFEDLREKSQLLIVTHQKRTMEAADALYGVSMKDGVSAVISHRMDDSKKYNEPHRVERLV